MVPIAHGNDGGGSIRIPAACCGLIGLKAARGRVSVGPESGDSFLVTDGVLTRDVADTVAAIDVLAGYEPGDSTWASLPSAPYRELAALEPGPLRIGLALNLPLEGSVLDPVCEAAARDAATLLESLGHAVEEVEPPWSDLDLLPDFTNAFGPQISMVTMIGGQLAGRDLVPDDVEALTWEMWQLSRELNSVTMLSSLMRLQSVARSVVAFLTGFDAVLTPALAQRPLPIGEVHGQGPDPWDHYQRSGYFTPYTAVLNVTGQPAISVPLYQGKDGLPTAVQLIGPPAREETLLQLAAQLETALPWADRRPVLPV
jgi:amidase